MRKVFNVVLSFFVIIVAIFFIVGISSCSKSDSVPEKVYNTDGITEAPTEIPQKIYSIAEEIKLNNAVVVVTGMKKSYGSDYSKPKPGMEYIIVSVIIKNAGDSDNINYNPFDFTMQNSKGQIISSTFIYTENDNQLNSGQLIPGGEVEGSLVFEQPKADNHLILIYKPSFWNSSIIKIYLN